MSGHRPLLCCLQFALAHRPFLRASSSASSARWKDRQSRDPQTQEARVRGLRARAAFKLLELQEKHNVFKKGQSVVDLGYAPGSWSQVAIELVRPNGRVFGIDLIPAMPPRGVCSFQGDFLSPSVRRLFTQYVVQSHREQTSAPAATSPLAQPSYIDRERHSDDGALEAAANPAKVLDVVLSDMSAPWPPASTGHRANSLSNPYRRLMNTSGIRSMDHFGSMDLCHSALDFAVEMLRPDGNFICKFLQGGEDQLLEDRLKCLFAKVHREKPDSSRSESREGYFVALKLKQDVSIDTGRPTTIREKPQTQTPPHPQSRPGFKRYARPGFKARYDNQPMPGSQPGHDNQPMPGSLPGHDNQPMHDNQPRPGFRPRFYKRGWGNRTPTFRTATNG